MLFLWKLQVKNGTHDRLRRLLNQDLVADLHNCEPLLRSMLSIRDRTRSPEVEQLFRQFMLGVEQLERSLSEEQKQLGKICQRMKLKSGTTELAPYSGHVIVDEDVVAKLGDLVPCSGLSKNEIVVSPQFRPLLDALLAACQRGQRRPKIVEVKCIPVPSASRELLSSQERDAMLDKLGFSLRTDKQSLKGEKMILGHDHNDSHYDTIEFMSFSTRKTVSTGGGKSMPFKLFRVTRTHHDKACASAGPLHKPKTRDSQQNSVHSAGDAELHDMEQKEHTLSVYTNLARCAEMLRERHSIQVSRDDLLHILLQCQEAVSHSDSSSESASDPGSDCDSSVSREASALAKIVEDARQHSCPSVRDFQCFLIYWIEQIDVFADKVVLTWLTETPEQSLFGSDVIPLEACAQLQHEFLKAAQCCLSHKILKMFFVMQFRRKGGRVERLCHMASLHVIKHLDTNVAGMHSSSVPASATVLREQIKTRVKAHLRDKLEPLLKQGWNNAVERGCGRRVSRMESSMTVQPIMNPSRTVHCRSTSFQLFAPWHHSMPNSKKLTADKGVTFRIKQKGRS